MKFISKYRTYYIKKTLWNCITEYVFWSRMIWWKKIRSDIKKQILDYVPLPYSIMIFFFQSQKRVSEIGAPRRSLRLKKKEKKRIST